MMMMMDSIVDAGFARHFHELPAEIGESKSMKIMPHCHCHCHWESCHLAATALEKPRMQLMRIETTAVKHMEAHSVGSNSKDAEEEFVVAAVAAAAAAESVAVAAVSEPAVVEELILILQLQVKQAEAHFACEVVVPIDSGPDQIEDAAAAAAAQPGLECEPIHFDSYFD